MHYPLSERPDYDIGLMQGLELGFSLACHMLGQDLVASFEVEQRYTILRAVAEGALTLQTPPDEIEAQIPAEDRELALKSLGVLRQSLAGRIATDRENARRILEQHELARRSLENRHRQSSD